MSARCFASFLALSVGLAQAQTPAKVQVSEPWVRATVGQQQVTGAFLTLKAESAAKLVSAESPVATAVEIHEMSMEGDVMRMRQITALPLPAGEAVTLKPGGFHIMLTGLKQALRPGQTVPLTLWVEGADGKRSATEVQAQVKPLGTR